MDLVVYEASEDMIVEECKGVNFLKEICDREIYETIYETINNLKTLKDKVVSQNKILVDRMGNNDNYREETGDTKDILDCVKVVLNRLKNVPKNKFRKVFEKENG